MSKSRKSGPPAAPEAVSAPELAQQRCAMIAEAAYFKALDRGFAGSPDTAVEDWLRAEAEIDVRLAAASAAAPCCGTSVSDTKRR